MRVDITKYATYILPLFAIAITKQTKGKIK